MNAAAFLDLVRLREQQRRASGAIGTFADCPDCDGEGVFGADLESAVRCSACKGMQRRFVRDDD